jgi:hypothetical protein
MAVQLSIATLMGTMVGGLMLAAALLGLGHAFSLRYWILARANLLRVAIEVTGMDMVILMAMAVAFRLPAPWDDLIPLLTFSLSMIGVPCWAAVRLREPGDADRQSAVVSWIATSAKFACVKTTTTFVGLITFPTFVQFGLSGFRAHLRTELLASAGSLAAVAIIEFVCFRGVMELVSFVGHRTYEPLTTPTVTQRLVWPYRVVTAFIVLAIALWGTSYLVYYNRVQHPGWVFMTPLFSKPIPEIPGIALELTQPIEQTAPFMVAGAVPFQRSSVCCLGGLSRYNDIQVRPLYSFAFVAYSRVCAVSISFPGLEARQSGPFTRVLASSWLQSCSIWRLSFLCLLRHCRHVRSTLGRKLALRYTERF